MKGNAPRITLLGSNSGRNLGDAAIMSSIVHSLSHEMPNAQFYVPTSNPRFINENYGKRYKVKGISFMPWTLSIRMIGLTTFLCIAKSDLALICDGIIFGRKLWNPFFNWLINLVFVVPWAKLSGCKLALYSCGIGPFPSKLSERLARYVINSCDLIILREHDSKQLAEEIGVNKEIEVTGDAAFINEVSPDSVALSILAKEGIDPEIPIFGINVTSYFDAWLSSSERVGNRGTFLKTLADGIIAARAQLESDFQPVLFSTHPMDEATVEELASLIQAKVIRNSFYLSHDIQAVMRRCSLFMGMRFHSLILASSVGAPIIGLVYAPKVRGFMRYLACEDLSLELASINSELLAKNIVSAWQKRQEIQARQKVVIDKLKEGAQRAVKTVIKHFFP